MKLCFWAIGKANEEYVIKGVEEFTMRIQKYFPVEWTIYPVPKNAGKMNAEELKKKEAELLLAQIKKDDFVIALDEGGKQLSSMALSDFIQLRANESTKRMIFIIGGAFGLDAALLGVSNFKWSLSKLTFPHQLVRLILAEQIYRACSILRNEKYHHK